MKVDSPSGFGPGTVPPKNLQYLLLILSETNKVKGKTKLLKMHSLIEEEGHVKYSLPIDTHEFGPADFETFNYCKDSGLIEDILIESAPHDYYEISITRAGEMFFQQRCLPNMEKDELSKAKRIIDKYKGMKNREILEQVHRMYVDPYKDKRAAEMFIDEAIGRLSIARSMSEKSDSEWGEKEMLQSELRHIFEILGALRAVQDATRIGVIIVNSSKFLAYLAASGYRRNAFTSELFDFLDNYANKEGVLKSIGSSDFSDIPLAEREALFDAILSFEPGNCGGGTCATTIRAQ